MLSLFIDNLQVVLFRIDPQQSFIVGTLRDQYMLTEVYTFLSFDKGIVGDMVDAL